MKRQKLILSPDFRQVLYKNSIHLLYLNDLKKFKSELLLPSRRARHLHRTKRRWCWDFETASLSGPGWKHRKRERYVSNWTCFSLIWDVGLGRVPVCIRRSFVSTVKRWPKNPVEVISPFPWWTTKTVSIYPICKIKKEKILVKKWDVKKPQKKKPQVVGIFSQNK